jgi:hypothetical protein
MKMNKIVGIVILLSVAFNQKLQYQRNLDGEHSQAIASPSDATPPILDHMKS